MAPWGLCGDEFQDNALAPGVSPSLYVREARRLRGPFVFTENTPAEQRARPALNESSIGLGSYPRPR